MDSLSEEELPILSDEEAGNEFDKWSYFFAYYPNVLRDIYLIGKDIIVKNKKNLTTKANELKVSKQNGREWEPWTERYVLEYLNTLKKLRFWDILGNEKKKAFENSTINSKLSEEDKKELSESFFSYFRFKELSSWLIEPTPEFHIQFDKLNKRDFIEKSKPIYFYSDKSRFYNCFLRDIEQPKVKYVIKDDVVMRFWDVYIKWGTILNVIDRFNVSKILKPINNKEISIAYFIQVFRPFDLIEFISDNFNSRNIWIPELIFKIVKEYRYSVNDIKQFIIENITINNKITFERTSEIFLIKGKTSKKNIKGATYLYPIIDDFYISNLIIRK